MTNTTEESVEVERHDAADVVRELKQRAVRDERHLTDKQIDGLVSSATGPQRRTIERLAWNVKVARDTARERQRKLEERQDTAELLDRKLPMDAHSEATVLGTLIINPDLIDKHGLTPAHFYDDDHEKIFQAMLRVASRGEPVDVRHLREELIKCELWDQSEILPKVVDAMQSNAGPRRFQEYVDHVDAMFRRRELFYGALDIIRRVHTDMPIEELENFARQAVS